LVRVDLGIVQSLSVVKSVVVKSLERPLSDKDRELAITLTNVLGLATDGSRHVLRVSTGSGKEVNVRVDDEVSAGGVQGRPEHFAEEAVLKHERDSLVDLGNAGQDAVDVRVDPVDTGISQTSRGGKAGKVVAGLVDGRNGERALAARSLDEVEDRVNSLEAVVEVGRVLEPAIVPKGLTNGQSVDTARKRVKANDDVHVVLVDGVVSECSKVRLLVSRVKHASGDLGPSGISGRNSQSVDTLGSHLINVGKGEEGCIALLKFRTALCKADVLAPGPLIREGSNIGCPPLSVLLQGQYKGHLVLEVDRKLT
jgi:hypothetical protein